VAKTNEPWGKTVAVEFEDGIAWVYFNRPEKRNAMSIELNREMRATIEHLATDDRCRVLVLSGKGAAFAAGMDLQDYFRATDNAPDTTLLQVRRETEEWQWRWLRMYPKATIAMINGWCFGGAFAPMVSCDLAIAAEEATFGLSEINWGIIPGGNASKAMVDLCGQRATLYYAMTGEPFDGKKAAEMGLVNEAVPLAQLKDRVRSLARTLLEKNDTTLRGVKVTVKRIADMDWDTSADYLYAKISEAIHLGGGANRKGAMKAFLDDKKFKPGVQNYSDKGVSDFGAPAVKKPAAKKAAGKKTVAKKTAAKSAGKAAGASARKAAGGKK
jgi:trans-feruloyl-CoA hydratase/vanillin synthase